MSRDGAIELVWGGDERRFRLGIGELLSLQEKLDSGPAQIAIRFRDGTWRVQDLQEVFRLSLMGGGADVKAARALVDAFIVPGRLAEHVIVGFAIIMAALQGNEGEPAGKDQTAEPSASPPQTSTEPALH